MCSMWNAPSDLDYYEQSGFGGDEPETEPEPELGFPELVVEPPELEEGEQQ